ncbi:MAG: alpha/beta hydrolase [Myxococcales bacterium]|nr:alpha/beta hydrolase [Myxococcales bacterium]
MLTLSERMVRRVLNVRGLHSRWLPTSVGRLHALDGPGRGTLPPVVMLHGFSANSISYVGLLRRLAPHVRRLSAPDCPGHGFSDLPRGGLCRDSMLDGLFEVLDQLIDEPVVLLGTSMGGFGAIRYAARSPHKVCGLVLVCPGGAPMAEPDMRRFFETFRVERHRDALRFVDRMLSSSPPGLRHLLAHGIRGRFTNPQLRRLLDSIGPEDLLRPEELRALPMPTLMLWGREEMILPPDHLEFFRRHLPQHAQVEIWSRFGHCGYLERPTAVARRVLEFARTADSANLTNRHPGVDESAQTMTRCVHRTAHLH